MLFILMLLTESDGSYIQCERPILLLPLHPVLRIELMFCHLRKNNFLYFGNPNTTV